MRYCNVVSAVFLDRPNRFIAHVSLYGNEETVHVKNTGRCRELLIPGAEVYLAPAENRKRKTKYDLIAVRKNTGALFNIDSQAPNAVVQEWLQKQKFSRILPEYTYGNSRIDFYIEKHSETGNSRRILLEVKGCTLEREGIGFFPDAPTERGVKHLRELTGAAGKGYETAVAFVMQTPCMTKVLPNEETHPEFAEAMRDAEAAGVRILCLPCRVEPDRLEIIGNTEL